MGSRHASGARQRAANAALNTNPQALSNYDPIKMKKDQVISLVLALLIILKVFDLYVDSVNQVEIQHLVQEWVLILLSLSVFLYLVRDIRQRSKQASLLTK